MAEIIKNLKKGFVQGTGIVIAMFVGGALYVFASSLTATDGETLTATKWNALVDKVNSIETTSTGYDYDSGRFDVGTTSCGYGGAVKEGTLNVYLLNHNLNSKSLDVKVFFRSSSTSEDIYNVDFYDKYLGGSRAGYGAHITHSDRNNIKVGVVCDTYSVRYVSNIAQSATTGQYRVLIKKLP